MKIAILGYTGAGKSTLARKIGEKYDIPVLHLDKVNYTKNWKIRDIHESKEIVEDFLENDSWVIDGNYSKLEQDRRVKEADKIIFLDFPRWECLKRAYKRYKENLGKTREDVAPGNTEKFDFIFIKWILNTSPYCATIRTKNFKRSTTLWQKEEQEPKKRESLNWTRRSSTIRIRLLF